MTMEAVQVRYFTPKEANRTLPLVRRIVNDILATAHRARELYRTAGGHSLKGLTQAEADRLDELYAELKTLGCSYRDWNFTVGLVDFPARLNGREVYLCWRSDEPDVRFYHEPDAGYAGRKPIPPEFLNH
jgi:hypothetical protein